jgi:GTP-binding protein Era
MGIVNLPEAQLLFLDTPGVLDPKGALNATLVAAALNALSEADVVVWLVEPRPPASDDQVLLPRLRQLDRPLIVVINKIDTVAKAPAPAHHQRTYSCFPPCPSSP